MLDDAGPRGLVLSGHPGPLSSGSVQQLTVNAQPGIYVLDCFMDTQDGREHTRLGMEHTIRITK